jgi:tetratricopeptide (TPR) repeat protein
LFSGNVHLMRGEGEEALECYDQADAINPDMPGLELLRGTAHNQLGEWDRALARLEAYRDLLGEDNMVCMQMGEALRGMERFGEAARQYRTSLDHDPANPDALLGLLLSLTPEDDHGDVQGRFSMVPDRDATFDYLVQELLDYEHYPAIEHLARARLKADPGHAGSIYYLALARAHAGDGEQATDYFRQWLGKEKDDFRRKVMVPDFLGAMLDSGFAAEAYQLAPDPDQAFDVMARDLLVRDSLDELEQLVQHHEKKSPRDPVLPFYRGAVHAEKGEYELAHKEFEAGMKNPPREDDLDLFRESRVSAMYHVGRGMQALEQVGPREQTFTHLAEFFLLDRDAPGLEQLLAAFHKTDPDSPELFCYEAMLKLMCGEVQPAIPLIRKAYELDPAGHHHHRYATRWTYAMFDLGKALEGYRLSPDRVFSFSLLAYRFEIRKRSDELKQLLAEHSRLHPDDDRREQWNLVVYWLDKDYAKLVHFIREKGKEAIVDEQFLYWRDEYLLRSLIRMKRAAEAEQEARDITQRAEANWETLVLAHALLGDVEKALHYANMIEEDSQGAANLYEDKDLAPILRGDVFTKFREKYPPPTP